MVADKYDEGQVGVAMSFIMVGFSIGQLIGKKMLESNLVRRLMVRTDQI